MAFSPSPPAPTASWSGTRPLWFLLCALAATLPAGCGQTPEITAYDVPKTDTKETEGKNRLLAAILLHQDNAWHFKLVGPKQQMAEHESEYLDFLKTVRFDKEGQPTWTAPDSWQRQPNRRGRFAAFTIGKGLTALELTVVSIPAPNGDIKLDANIVRWRRQMHRGRIEADALAQFQRTITIAGKEATLIDLTGSGSGKTERRPDEPEVVELPSSSLKKYETPPGWIVNNEQDPQAEKMGIRRAAAFDIVDGAAKALVTVIPMENSGMEDGGMRLVRSNIDRWAQQVRRPPLRPDEIKKVLRQFPFDDIEDAFLIDLVGPEGAGQLETVAVVVMLADRFWVFKMSGPAELVGKQKTTFENFVKSAKFEGGR